ncbi:ChbG/HpnK family deacetylase [candidate division KSB1 bacterium]|nr:ChbG/HpnK family deacetylase [candidate division KSB1 bacterium]RQW01910.1 MAG: ChbG/HpnK family deacetylase [candidate division KSB1 bacterium]
MISLIVNADDFGRTCEINRGIVESFHNGIVTSASLLVNFPAFADAAELINLYDMPVGIHFNLTEGRPVSDCSCVPSLVDRSGQFYGKFIFYHRLITGCFREQEMKRELAAQMEKCLEYGLKLDHYDGHHHIHAVRAIAPLARSLGRMKMLPFRQLNRPHRRQSLAAYIQHCAIWLMAPSPTTARPQTFWGSDLMVRKNKLAALEKILQNLKPGLNELMCHPGYVSQEDIGSYNVQRQEETDALCKCVIKKMVDDKKIGLLSYRELILHYAE